jgi:signal peptidase
VIIRTLKTALWAVPATLFALLLVLATGILPYRTYVVQNGSMTPTIPQWSLILVHQDHYQVGQVVTFHKSGVLVTHRVTATNPDGTLVSNGDANRTTDPDPLPPSEVIGGVVHSVPWVGGLMVFFRTLWGIATLVIAVVMVMIATHRSDAKAAHAATPTV